MYCVVYSWGHYWNIISVFHDPSAFPCELSGKNIVQVSWNIWFPLSHMYCTKLATKQIKREHMWKWVFPFLKKKPIPNTLVYCPRGCSSLDDARGCSFSDDARGCSLHEVKGCSFYNRIACCLLLSQVSLMRCLETLFLLKGKDPLAY